MEYMFLLFSDETAQQPQPGTPEFDAFMAEWMTFNQTLIDNGHWVSGANLQPTMTATTLRRSAGSDPTLTDGPFIETKEALGGYYLVKAADLDEALRLAALLPSSIATVEVRPVAFRPDAPRA